MKQTATDRPERSEAVQDAPIIMTNRVSNVI